MPSLNLILMAGMPGTGKSTVAREIGSVFGFPVIDKDVIATALLDAEIPEDQMQPAAYDTCFALTRDLLMQHQSLILDTPAVHLIVWERAQALCNQAGATLIPVLCVADRDIRNHRVASRVAMRSQPAGQSRTPGYARERFAHLPPDRIELVTDVELPDVLDQVIRQLRSRGGV